MCLRAKKACANGENAELLQTSSVRILVILWTAIFDANDVLHGNNNKMLFFSCAFVHFFQANLFYSGMGVSQLPLYGHQTICFITKLSCNTENKHILYTHTYTYTRTRTQQCWQTIWDGRTRTKNATGKWSMHLIVSAAVLCIHHCRYAIDSRHIESVCSYERVHYHYNGLSGCEWAQRYYVSFSTTFAWMKPA